MYATDDGFTKLPDIIGKDYISEREVSILKRRLNNKKTTCNDIFKDHEDGFRITKPQAEKGLSWLLNLWKTPRGVERKNNPFGYREQDILEHFTHFQLVDFYDAASYTAQNMDIHFYVPIYRVFAEVGQDKDVRTFDYYVEAGIPQIIG